MHMKRKRVTESENNKEIQDLYSLYSDMYKERYNIRPRGVSPSDLTVEELQAMIDDLQDVPWFEDDDREHDGRCRHPPGRLPQGRPPHPPRHRGRGGQEKLFHVQRGKIHDEQGSRFCAALSGSV